jgi:FkbM family methyltransferase
MKKTLKKLLHSLGYTIIPYKAEEKPGSDRRPIGCIKSFLEDLKARHFLPHFILDVGANRGDWTRMAKGVFPQSQFMLIEPQPEMREPLNILCSEFQDISWIEAGAGSQEGQLVQTIWSDLAGSSFLPPPDENLLLTGKQRQVKIVTIDTLLASQQSGIPDLVKLDIQGFELEALKGASSLFGTTELFILEISLYAFDNVPGIPIFREVIDFMGARGYEVYDDITGHLRRPFDGALGQVDLAFAKKDGVLRRSNLW